MSIRVALLIFCLLLTPKLFGQDLFPAGSESKGSGIESALHARGGAALLYNPANLSASHDSELDAELGFVSASQSFEHRDFDPVTITIRSPIASVGYVGSFYDPKLRYGFGIFPAKKVDQNIPGIPRRIAGIYASLDTTIKEQVVKISTGMSYEPIEKLVVGLSLIYTMEEKKIDTESVADSSSVIKFDGKSNYVTPVIGFTYRYESNTIAFSYRPSHIKTYKGSQQSALDEAPVDPQTADYQASNIGLGYLRQIDAFDVGYVANIQSWSEGKSKHRDGLESQNKKADFKDIIEHSLQFGYHIDETNRAGIAYSILPSPWGDGHYATEVSEQVEGAEFGRSNAIDRKVACLNYSYLTEMKYNAAIYYLSTNREVSSDGDHPGYYQLEVAIVSIGIEKAF